jgi:hypothetical protein
MLSRKENKTMMKIMKWIAYVLAAAVLWGVLAFAWSLTGSAWTKDRSSGNKRYFIDDNN